MRHDPIHGYRSKIQNIILEIGKHSDNTELQSHLSRYLCILISGYIEVSCRAIFTKYSVDKSNINCRMYIQRQLKGFRNPKYEKILQLIKGFKFDWGEPFDENDDYYKSAVDAVVDNRHKLAHGEDVGISLVRVKDYFERVDSLIEKMIEKTEYNRTQ